ncbi:MAG TPA: hypothetical protein VIL66_09520 [Bacillota bacterium]
MRKGIILGLICCCLFLVEAPAFASGLVDEVLFTSEWWPEEDRQGEIEFFTLGFPGENALDNSYFLTFRQQIKADNVVAINGSMGYDKTLLLNTTAKFGNPNFYYGFGGLISTVGKRLLFLPRVNVGGKLGPDFFKLVLDADFYTLVLVNAGKFEVGVEILPLEQLRFYGGLVKPFTGTVVTSELLTETIYQLAVLLKTEPFFAGGEVYFIDGTGPVVLAEAGLNFSFLSLCGRVCLAPQEAKKPVAYTVGLKANY